jgi:hypothetical protein
MKLNCNFKISWKSFTKSLDILIKSLYNEYNSSRYLISTIIKMWTATLFAKYKFIGERMWTATLLARYKWAGGKMLIIVKYGVYKVRSHIFIKEMQ